MEGEDYTYVNGEGSYKGNILLDPQGTVTRAEMYDAIAEVSRPVTVTIQPTPLELGAVVIAYGGFTLLVALMVASFITATRKRRGN